jgi:hypothetical protein
MEWSSPNVAGASGKRRYDYRVGFAARLPTGRRAGHPAELAATFEKKRERPQTDSSVCNPSLFMRKIWRRHPDLNRRITVLQTVALPLGYAASGAGNGI